MFTPLLKKLIDALPEELKSSLDPTVHVIGFKNLKFAVNVSGSHAREIEQRCQQWFDQAGVMDISSDMS